MVMTDIQRFHMEMEVDRTAYEERSFEFLRLTIMEDIRNAGFIPVIGTEVEHIIDVSPDIVRVEVDMWGKHNPYDHHKIEYITEDGYVQWNSTESQRGQF